jgi:hypothetical protein
VLRLFLSSRHIIVTFAQYVSSKKLATATATVNHVLKSIQRYRPPHPARPMALF